MTPSRNWLLLPNVPHNALIDRQPNAIPQTVPWDADRLLQQLTLGEDSRVDFKEAIFERGHVREPRRERIANQLAALGNTVGGTLIFSVSASGKLRPMGRRDLDALESQVREACADNIRPPLPFLTQRGGCAGRSVRARRGG